MKKRHKKLWSKIVQELFIPQNPASAHLFYITLSIFSRKIISSSAKLRKLWIFKKTAIFSSFSDFSRLQMHQSGRVKNHFKGFSIPYNCPIGCIALTSIASILRAKNEKNALILHINTVKKKISKNF